MINKKGNAFGIITWMVVGIVMVVFFAFWIYAHNLFTNTITSLPTIGTINVSQAAQATFGQVNTALNGLRFLSFIIIFAMILSVLITTFFSRAHPVMFIVHLFITVVSFIFAVYISNSYESLMTNATIGTTLASFTGSSYILLNLPITVLVFGIMGAVIGSIGLIRGRKFDGSVV